MPDKTFLEKTKSHISTAINTLKTFLIGLLTSADNEEINKADKLAYWIEDYTRFLSREKTFEPKKQMSYRRGDIVKVHLGYRIGNEEGGLHYGVVLDRHNSKSSGVVTVIPLTSKKPGKKINKNSVDLGNELFRLVISKHDKLHSEFCAGMEDITAYLKQLEASYDAEGSAALKLKIKELDAKNRELSELKKGFLKMKEGSIALTNQIVTISKLRIYEPRHSGDMLYGIRLTDTMLGRIDEKLQELYL